MEEWTAAEATCFLHFIYAPEKLEVNSPTFRENRRHMPAGVGAGGLFIDIYKCDPGLARAPVEAVFIEQIALVPQHLTPDAWPPLQCSRSRTSWMPPAS